MRKSGSTAGLLVVLAVSVWSGDLQSQSATQNDNSPFTTEHNVFALELNSTQRAEFERALNQHDYRRAEQLLLDEANRDPQSVRAARLLEAAGGVFFLDGQYLSSAVAWKKAEAIAPLDERSSFTLAMAYVKLGRQDWARLQLEKLLSEHPNNALYLYWLARIDYDAQNYASAIRRLGKVIAIDGQMMRAYDLLGLCYDYLGKMDEALKSYNRAVELNRLQPRPSPWPNLDLAVSLIAISRFPEAEENLREALRHDPNLPQANYQLGRVLEMQGKYQDALQLLQRASELDPAFAEPHYLLGRIYHRLGRTEQAKSEIEKFKNLTRIKEQSTSANPPPPSLN